MRFDLGGFVDRCRAAVGASDSHVAVRELVAEAVSDRDIIHTVTNPLGRISSALQIYGGDFFAAPRSEWDPETLREQPFDMARTSKSFEEAAGRSGMRG